MKKLLLIPFLLILAGCSFNLCQIEEPELPPEFMTNDEIISETQKCEEAGLKAYSIFWNFNDESIYKIQCRPK